MQVIEGKITNYELALATGTTLAYHIANTCVGVKSTIDITTTEIKMNGGWELEIWEDVEEQCIRYKESKQDD